MAISGMSRRAALALVAASLVSGCSGGGIWPFRRRAQRGTATTVAATGGPDLPVADGTTLMPFVRLVAAERGRQGVILRAEGLAPTQGFHSPELRPVGRDEAGFEIVEFRARPPAGVEPVGSERSRLVQVGRFYPPHQLRDLRGFRVVAAQNAATAPAP